jgi:hypothetical protein
MEFLPATAIGLALLTILVLSVHEIIKLTK